MKNKLFKIFFSTALILTSISKCSTVSTTSLMPDRTGSESPSFMKRSSYGSSDKGESGEITRQIDNAHARTGLEALLEHGGARRVDTETTPTELTSVQIPILTAATLGQVEILCTGHASPSLTRPNARHNLLSESKEDDVSC